MMAAAEYNAGVSVKELLETLIEPAELDLLIDVQVHGLAQDSRYVESNYMFVAFAGQTTHGLFHAKEAVKRGASIILWDDEFEEGAEIINEVSSEVLCLQCPGLREKIGDIASRFYGQPTDDMYVVGITGTDGKTSISHFIAQCLDGIRARCGVLGTLGNGFIGQLGYTGLTTVGAVDVHRSFAELKAKGATRAVMEVSSHGLDQGRINGVKFDVVLFSNFSQDHLDYHETLEKYAEAKSKLFSMPGLRLAVINLDDAFGLELAEKCKKRFCVWGYSMQEDVSELLPYADFIVHARNVETSSAGFRLKVHTPKGDAVLNINLLGSFNISNVLATLCTLLVSNVQLDQAIARLATLKSIAGRMEVLAVKGKPVVIIDFAHTPKGLESACRAVKEHYSGKLWCVFGCGGDRDKGKRPAMAKVAEQFADKVVLTSDNPRHEDPQTIIDEILEGFENCALVDIVADRKHAITHAIEQAKEGEVVLIAGKGHERSQIVGDTHIAFDDRQVASDCLGMSK